MSALTQMLREVAWSELDVLIVDMPPGTGDAQLTLAQQVPLSGAVIVSTPQDLALLDARRGVAMFEKVNVPVLGIVENMASYCCPNCGHVAPIFGHGGARAEAEKTGVPFLGEIPLDMEIRTTSDDGTPDRRGQSGWSACAGLSRDRANGRRGAGQRRRDQSSAEDRHRMSEAPYPRAQILGLILAGGRSQRMGGRNKALLRLAGKTLAERVRAAALPQVGAIAVSANADAESLTTLGGPVIADTIPGHAGPLAGIAAAMEWAQRERPQIEWILSAPADAPFLPADLGDRLWARPMLQRQAGGASRQRWPDAFCLRPVEPVFA